MLRQLKPNKLLSITLVFAMTFVSKANLNWFWFNRNVITLNIKINEPSFKQHSQSKIIVKAKRHKKKPQNCAC